ncbi:protein SMALL AUXIN UP-REGULATED RNA 12 [Typha latifolia]|uniref:protein SMALL AUXIN UP-REGULATED RNA 12 n=1 Tax=Typha latifolia TaxID=4733 RepID=UPI003C2D8485
MKVFKRRFLLTLLRRWKKISYELPTSISSDKLKWILLNCKEEEEETIPEDVPKGHTVVYVGEERTRYVIKVAFLEHPLFHELLDQAREEYGFKADTKLWIPCDENNFLGVLHNVGSQQQKFSLCS